MKRILILIASHGLVLILGFALGTYMLPILISPTAPSSQLATSAAEKATYAGQFHRDLKDSDLLHWGEGKVSVSQQHIVLLGKLAPGPDYKLYLSPAFVETEADFLSLKSSMVRIGDIKTFENFIVPVPASVDIANYNTVIVWCEAFSQFISAAKYR